MSPGIGESLLEVVHLVVLSKELVFVFHLSPLRYFLLLGSQTYRDSR